MVVQQGVGINIAMCQSPTILQMSQAFGKTSCGYPDEASQMTESVDTTNVVDTNAGVDGEQGDERGPRSLDPALRELHFDDRILLAGGRKSRVAWTNMQ